MKVGERAKFYLDRKDFEQDSDFHIFLKAAVSHDELVDALESAITILEQRGYDKTLEPLNDTLNRAKQVSPEIVVLTLDDQDHHGAGCNCGLCNSNGKSYGVGIFPSSSDGAVIGEVLERVYGPSEEAAMHNAKMVCKKSRYVIARYV